MIHVKDAVLATPSFEKIATHELSKDTSEWNQEILEKFFEEIPYLPRDINCEVVINDIKENEGYCKGSIVTWYNNRHINFPVIVKDFQLSPFDVFITQKDGKFHYHNATEVNVKTLLMSNDLGKIENMYDAAMGANIKTPGNIAPKRHINLSDDYNIDYVGAFPNFTKMSSLSHKSDLDHLKSTLEKHADVAHAFHDTTGDLIDNIINLYGGNQKQPAMKAEGKLDLNNIVDAKRALTVLDSELFDTKKLQPITAPCVAELRMYQYPSMEDFMDRGDDTSMRLTASKVGKPITGVVIDFKEYYDNSNCPIACCDSGSEPRPDATDLEKAKAKRKSRPQIFIDANGKYYSTGYDYSKSGICFYGSSINTVPGMLDKVIQRIEQKTTNDYLRFNKDNHGNGDDKIFHRNLEMKQGKEHPDTNGSDHGSLGYSHGIIPWPATIYPDFANQKKQLLVIYGSNDVYSAMKFTGAFKRYKVNGTMAYACSDCTLIPARVVGVQLVGSVTDPVYKIVAGCSKKIYLIPENSIVINMDFMQSLNNDDFMVPERTVQKLYEDAAIMKVAIDLGSDGYRITGEPIKSLQKIAHFSDNTCLKTTDAIKVLRVMGMEKSAAEVALKNTLMKCAEFPGSNVVVYGVRNDYVNQNVYAGIEKTARIKEIYTQLAKQLKTDLIKEASLCSDPESVDVMLGLNFINEDNLTEYIDQIHILKKTIGKLSAMLVASRMGLSDIDETATKKAIDGIDNVVKGLENIKLSISK